MEVQGSWKQMKFLEFLGLCADVYWTCGSIEMEFCSSHLCKCVAWEGKEICWNLFMYSCYLLFRIFDCTNVLLAETLAILHTIPKRAEEKRREVDPPCKWERKVASYGRLVYANELTYSKGLWMHVSTCYSFCFFYVLIKPLFMKRCLIAFI